MSIEKAREQRLRRALHKLGYTLTKFRTRKQYPACQAGGYMITIDWCNGVAAGGAQWFEQLTLDEVEDFLVQEMQEG